MMHYQKTIKLDRPEDTSALGARLSAYLKAGDVVALRGTLGAGKTSLARGLIGALCGAEEVPSPTYTLVQTYAGPQFDIWHFDLYRLENEADVWELGIEDALDTGVCLIEWPQRIEGLLSGAELTIEIVFEGEGRRAQISGDENWGERLAGFN
ncbi:MAG: tRNA (adenosine(37)-N6)-threonylcarbamoyltransferase complex ATPase subunit type 1 TsaE [Robiginitomaculum sp.]|nr:MAG: tRNA (adenosine(37)-N6)-threonylcarbamoyltransferase complex ATPase subunit type 1 TsaE [Robiginitomaculum sp.]